MCAALTDNDSLDFRAASRAGPIRASKYLQRVAVTSLVPGDGIKVGLAGSQGGAQVVQAPLQHPGDRPMKRSSLGFGQRGRNPTGMYL